MSSIAIVYWSGTGNTEALADLIAQGVRGQGGTAELIAVSDFTVDRLDDFDAFALGCPAMGAEDLEDSEFLPLYEELEPKLAGRKVVLFGSYDWGGGEWMEIWEKRASDAGINVIDSVTAHEYPDGDASAECLRIGALLVS